jgi:hypothetical protein
MDQILACDFFTVETISLKTIYVLFFIELGTRRIYLAGCTTNPDFTWVRQQDRSVDETSWEVSSAIITGSLPLRFLARDRIFAPYTMCSAISQLQLSARDDTCTCTCSAGAGVIAC